MMTLIPNTHSAGHGLGSWSARKYRRPKHTSGGIAYTTKYTPYKVGGGHVVNTPHTGSSLKYVSHGNLNGTPHAKRRSKQTVIHTAKRIKPTKGVKHTPLKKTVSRKSVPTNKRTRGVSKGVVNKAKNITPRVVTSKKKVNTPSRGLNKKKPKVGLRAVANKRRTTATSVKTRTVKGVTAHVLIKPKF